MDRLARAIGIGAAMRDQTPAQKVKCALAGFVVFTDHVKQLARRDVIGGRHRATVRHIESVNNREAQLIGSLNDTAAHATEDSGTGALAEHGRHKKNPEGQTRRVFFDDEGRRAYETFFVTAFSTGL